MDQSTISSRQHLYAHLRRIDLLLQRQIWRWRQVNAPSPQSGDEFRGLYISDAEVDAILKGIYPGSELVAAVTQDQDTAAAFDRALENARADVDQLAQRAHDQGVPLTCVQLQDMFQLDPIDLDALLIAVASEIDLRYERLYAYLQDDVTRKRPSVSLVLDLLCATLAQKLDARARFTSGAPLLRHRLIELVSDPTQTSPPLLAHYLKPDPCIVEFLLAAGTGPRCPSVDGRLERLCDLDYPELALIKLYVAPQVEATLQHLAQANGYATTTSPAILFMQGDRGVSKHQAAQALCASWQRPLFTVHLPRVRTGDTDAAQAIQLAARQAYLTRAGIYWRGAQDLLDNREDPLGDLLCDVIATYPVVSFVPSKESERQVDPRLLHVPYLARVRFERPSYALRLKQWNEALQAGSATREQELDLASVAGRFRLTQGQIREAVLDACHRAAQRPAEERALTTEDLFAAARARTSDQLRSQAKKVEPRHGWEDLILPTDQIAQLTELCDQMKYRHVVLGEWGFDQKMSMGKGLNALFAGPSGTGKTMAAEVIARDLGLDLYKIDLSTVMSKYIGETEKNLERIFGAAANSNAILFFDEADALFGKRSEVRDAHDRYANVEISYLLQKMEEYDGLVILTSNLSKNMDEAFVRRIHFTVEFPYPEPESRLRIWQTAFPAQAPLAAEVNLALLADRYRLTGGNIRNVALTAAFLAARDGGVIGMDHLLWATRREFQKMGRLANAKEFEVE